MGKLRQAAPAEAHWIVVKLPAAHCRAREYFRHPSYELANSEAERLAAKFHCTFAVYALQSAWVYEPPAEAQTAEAQTADVGAA